MEKKNLFITVGNRPMRITDEEMMLIKSTFAENDTLLKVLRKVLLPKLDLEAPLGEIIDLWQTVDVDNVMPEQAVINIKSMKMLVDHLERNLIQLKMLAGTKEETVEETKQRLQKDSTK